MVVRRRARSAGFVGYTNDPSAQNSPSCSGSCPGGFSCVQGTSVPVVCTKGSYCTPGSPLPMPCFPGTYGEVPGLQSQADCTHCPAGSWCSSGQRVKCTGPTYNPLSVQFFFNTIYHHVYTFIII